MTPDPAQPTTGQATPPPTGPATPPQSHWGAIPPSATTGGDVPGPSSNWASQAQQTHWGYQGGDGPAAHGTWDAGGDDYATSEDIQGLHDKLAEVHQSLTTMANRGQVGGAAPAAQNASLQGLTPSRMPPRADPLAASATQRQAAMDRMSAGQQQLATARDNTSARFAQRQTQGSWVTPSGSGNAASDSMNDATMSGALGKGTNSSLTPPSTTAALCRKRVCDLR